MARPAMATADEPVIAAQSVTIEQPVESTSLAARNHAPDEITVRFLRWHAVGMTAYQRGQFAGFRGDVARRLIASGIVAFAEGPLERAALRNSIITK